MPSFLSFVAQAQVLSTLKDPDTSTLIESLLGQLLLYEGPPVTAIPDVSDDISELRIIRSPKGRPWAVAQTWTTGPWRCLLMETPSIPMGRPITLKGNENRVGRTILDSRSKAFQQRIVMACQQLGIASPVGEGAVHTVVGTHRTFIAWRSREDDEAMNRSLRGDVDNFAKNILDGLQRAGVLPNDRGVFRLLAVKDAPDAWNQPTTPLDQVLHQAALDLQAKGTPLETIRVELRLSRAHMARIFNDYQTPRTARTRNVALDQTKVKQAIELISRGNSYKEARKKTGAPGKLLREHLAAHLRPRILDGETTIQSLAHELGLDTRTVSGLFRTDKEVCNALMEASEIARRKTSPKTKAQTSNALQKALQEVLNGTAIAEAAARWKVNQNSLTSKLARHKKAKKAKKTPHGGA